jgi:cytoskeleton protein RodZ
MAKTRVHTRYLTALEENDWSVLPTRVFAIGYVRAYAAALGLDEQLAVERFKRDVPDGSVPLQPPVGVAFEEVRRHSPRVIAAVAVVAVSILGWNVFQRLNLLDAPSRSELVAVPETWRLGGVLGQDNPAALEAPRPAPADQTVPALYVTPGLEEQLGAAVPEAGAEVASGPVARAFNPRGAVHGAAAGSSDVIIQARRPAYVVVRAGDRVLFARQMAAGEAWRAPRGATAVVDVADPSAFDVYVMGEHAGTLPLSQTPLTTLNRQAEAKARQAAAAEEAEAREAAARAAAAAPPIAAPVAAPVQPTPRPVSPSTDGPGIPYDQLTR